MAMDMLLIRQARAIINRYGAQVTVSHIQQTGYDPVARKPITAKSVKPVKSLLETVKASQVNGTSIIDGDMRVTLVAADLPFQATPNDDVTINGVVWNVKHVDTEYFGNTPITSILQVRK